MGPFTTLSTLRGKLLESPVWDSRRSRLFCCDIDSHEVLEFDLDHGLTRRWSFGTEVASLGLCRSGRLVIALRHAVVLFDPDTATQTPLWSGFDEPSTHRLNDGKVGPDGAFWVGTMSERPEFAPVSHLYRIKPDGQATVMVSGLRISNGLAWSPDGATMYHSDSRAAWVDAYDFDASTGQMSNRRRFCTLDEQSGRPDGGTCDAEGYYWSAGVSAGVLNRFAPDGTLDRRIEVPVAAPTSLRFCGADFERLFITSHSNVDAGTLDASLTGRPIMARAPVKGFDGARFAD